MPLLDLRHCPECGDEQPFEQPPCLDGHTDCQEWICAVCGWAVLLGGPMADADLDRMAAA